MEDAASGVKFEIYAEEVNGQVVFTIKHISGNADIQGFFVDLGNDGGTMTSVGSKSNNMNGSSNDGTKLDGWDYGTALGTVGGSDADYTTPGTEKSFTIAGITSLAQLEGAQLGIRATSTGADGEGSLKLADVVELPPPPPEDNFEEWGSPDISHVTLYWHDDAVLADTKPKTVDGWFTVKFDYAFGDPEFADVYTNDLDDNLDAFLDFLVAQGKITEAHRELLVGVAIKGGQDEKWYSLDGDPEPDPVPGDIPNFPIENNEVDLAYQWDGANNNWVAAP
jgi:hypothetical protein